MAHITTITGRVSELTVERGLLARGWEVSRPIVDERYDLVVREPGTAPTDLKRIQIKTIRIREDRKGEYVVYATNGKKEPYTTDDCEYLAGVYGDDFYLVPCTGLTEYWADEQKRNAEWRKFSFTDVI